MKVLMDKKMAMKLAIAYEQKKDDRRFSIASRLQYESQFDELVTKYNITYADIKEFKEWERKMTKAR